MRLGWARSLVMIAVVSFLQPGGGIDASPTWASSATTVLRGTVITRTGVTHHGYVTIENGRVASVSDRAPEVLEDAIVNTHGVILPGFVDLHNHVAWNVLPRWSPPRLFTNRAQWRLDPAYLSAVEAPFSHLAPLHFCDMNAYGEIRALVGGATSILATQRMLCIHGRVRNLDFNSGFYGTTQLNLEHVVNVLELPPASNPLARAQFMGAAQSFIANPFFEGLVIHLSEGTDAAAEEEFVFVQSHLLLNPKGVIIHGISLTPADFQAMATAGTALVWSPRSNLELYGQTADLAAALDAGVEIALAPDWAVTGSSNMLDELKVAARWNRERLGGRLSNRRLIDMVTSIPARIVGVDDEVGGITPGLRADLLVIRPRDYDDTGEASPGEDERIYRSVVDATAPDVQLVFIDGVPLYGDREMMRHFWDASNLEGLRIGPARKALATSAAGIVLGHVVNRLAPALAAEGTSLAPLTEDTGSMDPSD